MADTGDTSTVTMADNLYQEFLKEQEAFHQRFKAFTEAAEDIVKQLDGATSKERDYKMHLAEVVAEQHTSLTKLRAKYSRLKAELALARSERDELKDTVARKRARRTTEHVSETPQQSRVVPTAWPVNIDAGGDGRRPPFFQGGAASQSQDVNDDDNHNQ